MTGILGSLVIARWLDKNLDKETEEDIQKKIESESDNRVSDIHVWKVGPLDYAGIISLVTHHPRKTAYYKDLISDFSDISHLTLEINRC
jgi:Co/Zn/Cd efflux system component